jgi:Leukotriene A4 hydrolase, C-terminal.
MSSQQVQEFLAQLLEEKPLSVAKLQAMEKTYNFNSVVNSEIRFRYV